MGTKVDFRWMVWILVGVLGSIAACSDDQGEVAKDAAPADGASPADAAVADASVPEDARADAAPDAAVDAAVDAGPFPIMLAAGNYADSQYHAGLLPYRPYFVYAWCSDPALSNPGDVYAQEISTLEGIQDTQVEKMVMFSSNVTLNEKLSDPTHVQALLTMGVTTIGYNSEGGLTPQAEMDDLGSTDPGVNSVARFAAFAAARGFRTIWGPIRVTADNVSDAAISVMFDAGLGGVALQEQQFINHSCVADRAAAVQTTATRYRTLAAQAGASPIHVTVQVMPSTCLEGDTYAQNNSATCGTLPSTRFAQCDAFVDAIAADVDSIAIWAMGTDRDDLIELVTVLRTP